MSAQTFQELYLGRNSFTAVPSSSLNGPVALKTIALNDNHIGEYSSVVTLIGQTFNGISFDSLIEIAFLFFFFFCLFIRSDKTQSTAAIRAEAFDAQSTLERIDLRHNRINAIDGGAFRGLTKLKDVFLSGNRLVQLNSDVFEVNNNQPVNEVAISLFVLTPMNISLGHRRVPFYAIKLNVISFFRLCFSLFSTSHRMRTGRIITGETRFV